MRIAPFALITAGLAWMAGALWYMGHRDACGCGAPAATIATTAPINIGASAPTSTATTATATVEPTAAPTIKPVDPLLLAPFTLPFVKNQGQANEDPAWAAYHAALLPYLAMHPDAIVRITGHTDADGDADLNKRLSLARAEAVKAGLVSAGVAPERITTLGAGADEPIADNLTSAGKARNRRVTIALDPPPDTNALPQ